MGVHDLDMYPAIRNLLNIPEGEPLFILRAQDVTVVPVIRFYGTSALAAGATPEFVQHVNEDAYEFEQWQEANPGRVKIPD